MAEPIDYYSKAITRLTSTKQLMMINSTWCPQRVKSEKSSFGTERVMVGFKEVGLKYLIKMELS